MPGAHCQSGQRHRRVPTRNLRVTRHETARCSQPGSGRVRLTHCRNLSATKFIGVCRFGPGVGQSPKSRRALNAYGICSAAHVSLTPRRGTRSSPFGRTPALAAGASVAGTNATGEYHPGIFRDGNPRAQSSPLPNPTPFLLVRFAGGSCLTAAIPFVYSGSRVQFCVHLSPTGGIMGSNGEWVSRFRVTLEA